MVELELIRISRTPEGTFGNLLMRGTPICLTLEDPWNHNRPFDSCVPDGDYDMALISSPRWGWTYTLLDVVGRDHIRFHWGNTIDDTKGCVLLGLAWGRVGGKPGVLSSRVAFVDFMDKMRAHETASIHIETYARQKNRNGYRAGVGLRTSRRREV